MKLLVCTGLDARGCYWEYYIYLCLTSWLLGRLKVSSNPCGACLECPAALSRAVPLAVSLCCSRLQVVSTSSASCLCGQAQLRANTEQTPPPLAGRHSPRMESCTAVCRNLPGFCPLGLGLWLKWCETWLPVLVFCDGKQWPNQRHPLLQPPLLMKMLRSWTSFKFKISSSEEEKQAPTGAALGPNRSVLNGIP